MTRWIPVAVGIVGLAILATLAVKNLRGPIEAELLHGARSALGQVAGSDSLQVTAEGCDLTLRGVVQDAAGRGELVLEFDEHQCGGCWVDRQ